MKNTYIKLLALLFVASASVSCVNDDETFGINDDKPTATTSVTSLTLNEGESAVIPFAISKAINKPSQFKIELVGGNGGQDDITAGDGYMDADTGIYQDGFEITVPAYASSFEIPVNVILDLDQSEGNETITLKITAAGVRTIVTPEEYYVTLNIIDYQFCLWSFEMTDTYGDGWNGGYLEVDADGVITTYACQDLDGQVNVSETQTVDVAVTADANYTITYVSGGGTGNGPGWESENNYVITSPSGMTWADGPIPTAGVVTSGTSTCN